MRTLSFLFFLSGALLIAIFIVSFFITRTKTITIELPQSERTLENSFLVNSASSTNFNAASNSDNNSPKEPFYLKTIPDLRNEFILEGKNFLEVNLSTKKINLYENGELKKQASILTMGDPQGWGGSPVGLYKIMSGNKLSFSGISKVYMPYALRYYGKYYLHGEPFYPGGEKLVSSVSGGCIRLKDKDAEDIYNLTELNMPVLVIGKENDNYEYSIDKLPNFPEVSAKSYLVADLDSAFVFAEKNSEKQFSLASLTKLMTSVVVAENVDLRKSVLVKESMLGAYGSTEGLEPGKRFRVVELFYPLLIESSNDAAEVLSHFLGREKTIKMMNEKARAILMKNTKFVDPHGYDLGNVSTAQDLFQLARYILNVRPPILEITKGKKVINFDIEKLWNKNIFVNDPSFVGGKTGFLKETKDNGLFIFKFLTREREVRNIVIILLGSESNKTDTQKIYRWLQENYLLSPFFEG
jgi:hypothetical protein